MKNHRQLNFRGRAAMKNTKFILIGLKLDFKKQEQA